MKLIISIPIVILFFAIFSGGAHESNAFAMEPNDDCVRGAAGPIVRKSAFPKTKFKLQPDKLTGVETVKFRNGDKLIIRNWGCESYVLTFRFETARFRVEGDDYSFWFRTALQLMREVEKGLDPPIDIANGIDFLERDIERRRDSEQKEPEPGDEFDYGDGEIREFVSIGKVEKLSGKKIAVEISFAKGPL